MNLLIVVFLTLNYCLAIYYFFGVNDSVIIDSLIDFNIGFELTFDDNYLTNE